VNEEKVFTCLLQYTCAETRVVEQIAFENMNNSFTGG